MRYTITGRNIEVTPGLKAAVEKKIGKLEHFFTPDTEVFVALSAQKDMQKIEVTIPVKEIPSGQKNPVPICMYPLIWQRKSLNARSADIEKTH